MLRSILSVAVGFLTVVALVMPASIISARAMLGVKSREDMMRMTPTTPYLAVNLTYSAILAVVGGYITAWIAGRAPIQHAIALAGLMFLMGLGSYSQNLKYKTPRGRFYSGTLVVLGPVCALLGGYLRARG